ncbi:p115 like vesicle tethering protein [Dipodascopsis uninucleata]
MQGLLSGILGQNQHATSTPDQTITKLCDRLSSSESSESRRAAVFGLKGLSRDYRESVVSGGIRGLIGVLQRDGEDSETIRATLETILILFYEKSSITDSEDTDHISLWLADEFTQQQDTISCLINFLESNDFYVKLHCLKIMEVILSNRPERAQQCIVSAPLSITKLVATMDDHREAIQSEAIVFLSQLVTHHPDIQKLVAFENAFEKLFAIINREGDIDGGIVVRDCLNLISNLLNLNPSNQTFFRETSCIQHLSRLLAIDLEDAKWTTERVNNLLLVLDICRLFVSEDNSRVIANQDALFQSGVFTNIMKLAFAPDIDDHVRAKALVTSGDLIRGNDTIQEKFANIDVPYVDLTSQDEFTHVNCDSEIISVIQALLNWTLLSPSINLFEIRIGAVACLEGYLYNNNISRIALLEDAIQSYFSEESDPKTAKLLECLVDNDTRSHHDAFRPWFACVIMMYIIEGGGQLKDLCRSVRLDAPRENGESLTIVQKLATNLISCLQNESDIRESVAYLMLLSVWLFKDSVDIDDFLNESSYLQNLVENIAQGNTKTTLLNGLCNYLLAIIYEFSTPESPISRPVIYNLIVSRIGGEVLVSKLRALSQNDLIRDFNASDMFYAEKDDLGLPKVFFVSSFVNFFKDSHSRLEHILERDPEKMDREVNASELQNEDVSEQLETLQQQLNEIQIKYSNSETERQKALALLNENQQMSFQNNADHISLKIKVDELTMMKDNLIFQLEHRNGELDTEKDRSNALEMKVATIVETLSKERDASEERMKATLDKVRENQIAINFLEEKLNSSNERALQAEKDLQSVTISYNEEMSKLESKAKKVEDVNSFVNNLLEESEKNNRNLELRVKEYRDILTERDTEINSLHKQLEEKDRAMGQLDSQIIMLTDKVQQLTNVISQSNFNVEKLKQDLDTEKRVVKELKRTVQDSEEKLDDLLLVIADLEDKRRRDKAILKDHNLSTSDDERENAIDKSNGTYLLSRRVQDSDDYKYADEDTEKQRGNLTEDEVD